MTCRKPCYIQEIRAPVRLFFTHKLHRSQTPALQPAWVVCKYPVGLQAPCLAIKGNGTWGHVITYKFEQFLLLCAECAAPPRGLETNITFFYYFHCVFHAPRLLSLRTFFFLMADILRAAKLQSIYALHLPGPSNQLMQWRSGTTTTQRQLLSRTASTFQFLSAIAWLWRKALRVDKLNETLKELSTAQKQKRGDG